MPYDLAESDVQDVLSVFQVTGLNRDDQYYKQADSKAVNTLSLISRREPSPAKSWDDFKIFAGIYVMFPLSTCHGENLSSWGWGKNSDGDDMLACYRSLGVYVFNLTDLDLLEAWESPKPASFAGVRGIEMPTFGW